MYWLFLPLKQSVNGYDLYSKSTFGCDVLNFEAVLLLFDRSFPIGSSTFPYQWGISHKLKAVNHPANSGGLQKLKLNYNF